MRLTSYTAGGRGQIERKAPASPQWALPAIAVACLMVFALDRAIDAAPVQHLYYVPIILAARYYSSRGGIAAALTAIVLYHLANHSLLDRRYQESDIIQIALFLAVGLVTAKLVDDAEKLRQLAMTDDLAGLHNLRSFEIRLVRFVRDSRHMKRPLSLVVLDVDRLKSLNDQHGHLAGAEAVRTVGHIIARLIPADAVACRYGGDEFAIALPHCDEGRAEQVASRLCRAVSATAPSLIGREWCAGTLSISAGVACCCSHGEPGELESAEDEGEALFRAADDALYQAKERGRNRVHSRRPGASPT